MNRVAFSIFGFNIYYYSLCILLGIIVAYFLITRESFKHKIKKNDIIDLIFYAIIVGLIGARIYYVIFNLDYYLENLAQIIAVWNGGLAIHGGLIAGAIFVYFYCKKKNINFLRILDIIAPAIMIAQSFGRWGNFFNSEAHGTITSINTLKSMFIPKFIIDGMYIDGNYYYPTFLFESILCLIGGIVIILIRKNQSIKLGISSGLYLVFYGIIRFFIESLRTDSLMFFDLRAAQIISIISIIIGVYLIVTSRRKEKYLREE